MTRNRLISQVNSVTSAVITVALLPAVVACATATGSVPAPGATPAPNAVTGTAPRAKPPGPVPLVYVAPDIPDDFLGGPWRSILVEANEQPVLFYDGTPQKDRSQGVVVTNRRLLRYGEGEVSAVFLGSLARLELVGSQQLVAVDGDEHAVTLDFSQAWVRDSFFRHMTEEMPQVLTVYRPTPTAPATLVLGQTAPEPSRNPLPAPDEGVPPAAASSLPVRPWTGQGVVVVVAEMSPGKDRFTLAPGDALSQGPMEWLLRRRGLAVVDAGGVTRGLGADMGEQADFNPADGAALADRAGVPWVVFARTSWKNAGPILSTGLYSYAVATTVKVYSRAAGAVVASGEASAPVPCTAPNLAPSGCWQMARQRVFTPALDRALSNAPPP
jgi:hypothetical protein